MEGGQVSKKHDNSSRLNGEIDHLNRKCEQYYAMLKDRDAQIKTQKTEIKDAKDNKDVVVHRLNV